jgi:hypothetical protein
VSDVIYTVSGIDRDPELQNKLDDILRDNEISDLELIPGICTGDLDFYESIKRRHKKDDECDQTFC